MAATTGRFPSIPFLTAVSAAFLATCIAAIAQQQTIGNVSLADATVTGAASVSNGSATLTGNGTVTAKDHPAEMKLARGGGVRVCSTSGLHITAGAASSAASSSALPLMLALDRGAMEVHMHAGPSDIVMTPDLRLSVAQSGPIDLRIRVTPNGDTCVENRVAETEAPTIAQAKSQAQTVGQGPSITVASLFGDDTYQVMAGQRVLFEHANLHEVVDHEPSACGCPTELPPLPAASALALGPGQQLSPEQASAQHPFPAAVSEGLAPPPPVPQAPAGVPHEQVSATLNYAAPQDAQPGTPAASSPPATAQQQPAKGFFHRVGRFFKRLF